MKYRVESLHLKLHGEYECHAIGGHLILLLLTSSLVPMVLGTLSPGVNLPGHEANHSPPRAEVKNTWRYTSHQAWCGAYLSTGTLSLATIRKLRKVC